MGLKIKYSIFIVLIGCLNLTAQQTPQFTQYLFNHFAINPAVAGAKECLNAKIGYRNQWVGFEGAPKTAFGTFETRLKKKYQNSKSFNAVGVKIESDQYGPFGRLKLEGAYAYHFPIHPKITASFGLYLGIEQFRFNASEVTVINFNDNAIQGNKSSLVVPSFSPGAFVRGEKWYGGLSVQQFASNKINAVGTGETKLKHHYLVMGGYKIANGYNPWSLIPSTLIKMAPGAPSTIDLNLLFDYLDKVRFGVSYRNGDAIAGLVKFNAFNYFTFGYSYDFTLSDIQQAASNTHEIIIGISSCGNKEKDRYSCPTFD